jgi:hypothetical protein
VVDDRAWLLCYLIFNACLYAGQLLLYSLLFLTSADSRSLTRVPHSQWMLTMHSKWLGAANKLELCTPRYWCCIHKL